MEKSEKVAAPYLYKLITKFQSMTHNNYTFGTTKVAATTLWMMSIFVFLIISLGLLFGKAKSQQTDKYRTITTVLISITMALLFIYLNILNISLAGFNNLLTYYPFIMILLKILLLVYLLVGYCVLPLYKYQKNIEETDKYSKVIKIRDLISNILIIIGMLYTLYLLLWYNDVYKKRQIYFILLIISLAAGIALNNILLNL